MIFLRPNGISDWVLYKISLDQFYIQSFNHWTFIASPWIIILSKLSSRNDVNLFLLNFRHLPSALRGRHDAYLQDRDVLWELQQLHPSDEWGDVGDLELHLQVLQSHHHQSKLHWQSTNWGCRVQSEEEPHLPPGELGLHFVVAEGPDDAVQPEHGQHVPREGRHAARQQSLPQPHHHRGQPGGTWGTPPSQGSTAGNFLQKSQNG